MRNSQLNLFWLISLSSESDGGSGDDTGGHGHGEGTCVGGDLVGLGILVTHSFVITICSGEPEFDCVIDLPVFVRFTANFPFS